MTTIVCTRDEIAWESGVTYDGVVHPCKHAKVTQVDEFLFGCAGPIGLCLKAIEILVADEALADHPQFAETKEDFEILMVWRDEDVPGRFNRAVYSNENLYGAPLDIDFLAVGSGSRLALGAYYVRGSIEDAIGVAAAYDDQSCGPVFVRRLEDMLR